MILIVRRENTALRPRRLLLVRTGRSFLSRFALPARRRPAYANACEMILLHEGNAKLPRMILLHKNSDPAGVVKCGNIRNPFRICTLEENRSRHGRAGKSFKMTSLYYFKNNLPEMIFLRKKVGGTPCGRTFDAKPAIRPVLREKGYQQDALFAGSKVIRAIRRGLSS
jgi:hypothetical protein